MNVLHLNEDPYDWDGIKADYFVTQYTNEGYEGHGTAYSYSTEKDEVSQYNLGHCSCYGPCEAGPTSTWTLEKFKELVLGDRVNIGDIEDLNAAK
jgi:hypothetical protein